MLAIGMHILEPDLEDLGSSLGSAIYQLTPYRQWLAPTWHPLLWSGENTNINFMGLL